MMAHFSKLKAWSWRSLWRIIFLARPSCGLGWVPHLTLNHGSVFFGHWSGVLTQPDAHKHNVVAVIGRTRMHDSDYYREQAQYYRLLAASAESDAVKHEFLDLAAACEEAANDIDD